jgi:inorganic pyrophosphatase
MSIEIYLEAHPLSELAHYAPDPHAEAVSFDGVVRKHPYDEGKCLLIANPRDCDPAIMEFKIEDILGAEELPSPVDSKGTSLNLMRLWVKKGSFGIRYEPFEVDEPMKLARDSASIRERFMKTVSCRG